MRKALLFAILALLVGLTSQPAQGQQAVPGAPASPTPLVASDAPPESFVLSSAYPNPFKTATRFSVTMKERRQIRLEVFNMLGRRVKTLFDGTLPAGASHTFTLKAADLPSGLYLFRATTAQGTSTRQVTLLR